MNSLHVATFWRQLKGFSSVDRNLCMPVGTSAKEQAWARLFTSLEQPQCGNYACISRSPSQDFEVVLQSLSTINRGFWAYHRMLQSIDSLLLFFFRQIPRASPLARGSGRLAHITLQTGLALCNHHRLNCCSGRARASPMSWCICQPDEDFSDIPEHPQRC